LAGSDEHARAAAHLPVGSDCFEVIDRVKATHGGTLVDVRSRSQSGRIDRGVNAWRVRLSFDTLQQSVFQAKR
jgi:hypothetical protein